MQGRSASYFTKTVWWEERMIFGLIMDMILSVLIRSNVIVLRFILFISYKILAFSQVVYQYSQKVVYQ